MQQVSTSPNPSDAELEVLKCFWRDGDLSAREVQDQIAAQLNWTLSTTRTVLERMRAKGLLSRRSLHGVAVYTQAHPKLAILSGLMQRLSSVLEMDRSLPAAAFSGSQLLGPEDLAALEKLLNGSDAEPGEQP
jgi:BlaI family transcriptional regulator, penicillinase repressor